MTFDAHVQTVTQDWIVPKVTDQTLGSNVLTLYVLSNGMPWMGEQIKFPVKVSNHSQGGSFSDHDEFSINGENVRQMASFDPRAYYQSVNIGGIARSVNGITKTQLLNLVKVEMESVYQDMVDDIGTILYADGTGNSSKNFLGLAAAIDDGTGVATYGGLSRSDYTVWKSTLYSSIGAWDFSKARTLWNYATVGGQRPTLAVCNETVFGYAEADYVASVEGQYALIDQARATLVRNGRKPQMIKGLVGQAGFAALYYDGTPIVRDDKVGTGLMIPMNMDYIRWYGVKAAEANPVDLTTLYHEGNDYDKTGVPSAMGFNWTGFVRPANQYAFIGQFLIIGNMITPAPRLHTEGSGITS